MPEPILINHSKLTHKGPLPAAENEAEPVSVTITRPISVKESETEQDTSGLTDATAAKEDKNAEAEIDAADTGAEQVLLFKTLTCPNCKVAGAMLDQADIKYTTLNAEDVPELVEQYSIMQAPTLIIRRGDSFEKYRGVSDIKGWLMSK